MENFDLHNHSTRSDGLLTPTQLIELASRTGVEAIALTDHDSVEGLEEAADAARDESDLARRRIAARLRRELHRIAQRDHFPPPDRDRAHGAVERLAAGVEASR